uniref:hypothetical protein n=1 Tax=Thaumasiovibrio occultus TaxID=1891184 RepID=UPI000B353472|nr:hypothetical protein [Thaumasiovibrio occultus]
MRTGIFAIVAALLLQGCTSQPTLRYQPPEGATEQYYARALINVNGAFEVEGSLTTQLSVQPESSGTTPSLRVRFDHLQWEEGDRRRHRFNSFTWMTEEQQALTDHLKAGFVVTQTGEGGHEAISLSDTPLNSEPFIPLTEITDKLQFQHLFALLPPQIELREGATLNVQQGDFRLEYKVISLTPERVTISVTADGRELDSGLHEPTMIEWSESGPMPDWTEYDALTGWIEYDALTGVMRDGRVFYRSVYESDAGLGMVETVISVHQRFDALIRPLDSFRYLPVPKVESAIPRLWPLYERFKDEWESWFAMAHHYDPDIKVFNINDENYSIAPVQLRIYDEVPGTHHTIHSATLEDLNGNVISPVMITAPDELRNEYDKWGRYRGINLYPSFPVTQGVINVTLTAERDFTEEFISLPINNGKAVYQGQNYTIDARQIGERRWIIEWTQPSYAVQTHLQPAFAVKLNYTEAQIERIWDHHSPDVAKFVMEGTWGTNLSHLNRTASRKIEVLFAEEIEQTIDFYVAKVFSHELNYRIPTEALVGSVADQAPPNRTVRGDPLSLNEMFSVPARVDTMPKRLELFEMISAPARVDTMPKRLEVFIPQITDENCRLADVIISEHAEPLNWEHVQMQHIKGLDYQQYRVDWHWLYDFENKSHVGIDLEIACPEHAATELISQQDYVQEKPWLITLSGELAALPQSQMLKELKVYNEEGQEIHWVIPESEADFSFPTMKAWGTIAKVIWLEKTGEERVYRHRTGGYGEWEPMTY